MANRMHSRGCGPASAKLVSGSCPAQIKHTVRVSSFRLCPEMLGPNLWGSGSPSVPWLMLSGPANGLAGVAFNRVKRHPVRFHLRGCWGDL